MLMGLVTKNAILLVDYTITLGEGMSRRGTVKGRSGAPPPDPDDDGGHGLRHAPTALKIGEGPSSARPWPSR
jgi:hypothetical protein